MSVAFEPVSVTPSGGRQRRGRWIAIVLVSVLFHLTAADLLPRWHPDATDASSADLPLHAVLMPAIRTPTETETAPPPAIAPVVEPTPRRRTVPRTTPPPVFVPESLEPVPQIAVTPASRHADVPAASPSPAAAPAPVASDPVPPAAAPPPPPLPEAVAPQSARLHYKVVYIDAKDFNARHFYGAGSIDWSIVDGRYRSELVAAADFLLFKSQVLQSHSEGAVTAAGLAPDRYTETPRNRPTIATNFNRDARQNISFSASSTLAALLPGAQDRLSVLFQIGALLLADASRAVPQGRIEIPVAGVRGDVEPWLFEVQGIEPLEVRGETLSTTHLRRSPRPGSNDRTIDVWIAHRDGGYPARVLYTEPNGSTIEMTLDGIGTIP